MNIQETSLNAELEFPVVAHHSLIVEAARRDDGFTQALFAGFRLVSPVSEGNASANGKYVSYKLSVHLADREEMMRLDAAIQNVPGIKMCL